jgi:hypothetical protein
MDNPESDDMDDTPKIDDTDDINDAGQVRSR